MRVLQVNNYEAVRGGSDRVYQLTSKLLSEKGHSVATLACGTAPFGADARSYLLPTNEYYGGGFLNTIHNAFKFVYRNEAADEVDRIVAEFKPDIAHLHIFYGQLSNSVLMRLRTHGVPCVMSVHEYRRLCPVSTLYKNGVGVCERCADGSYLGALAGRCNKGSVVASALSMVEAQFRDAICRYEDAIDLFFMVSSFCKEKHEEYLPSFKGKSVVLYNFIRDEDVLTDAARPIEESTSGRFFYFGRLSGEKGVGLLCEAFLKNPDLELRVAGTGPLEGELRQQYGKAANISFLGKLDVRDIKEELSKCWFSIVPSEWYENNPMSVLESFAQGVPVLGARIGGIPELVIDGVTGLIFNPSDSASLCIALRRAVALSTGERSVFGSNARALIVERHSEEAYYKGLIDGYTRVVSAKSKERKSTSSR